MMFCIFRASCVWKYHFTVYLYFLSFTVFIRIFSSFTPMVLLSSSKISVLNPAMCCYFFEVVLYFQVLVAALSR